MACGSGELGNRLKELSPDLSVFGIDLSLNLLTWAQFPICKSDALCLPFKDNSFECILAGAAFHHFPDINRAMMECRRCLKPKGLFLAYEPNKYHPQRLIMMTNPLRFIFYKSGDHAISPGVFKKMLIQNGFSEIELQYIALRMKNPGHLGKLNFAVFDKIKQIRLNALSPILAPWFMVSAIKK
jgi:ubiquinone/menaquinone biosynthesis C-methylase UbiE